MQYTLDTLNYKGINYFRIPLKKNTELVEKINKLIICELICENLLGNPIKRDQLNFVYNNIKLINDGDEYIRKNFFEKDSNVIYNSIPKLMIYK